MKEFPYTALDAYKTASPEVDLKEDDETMTRSEALREAKKFIPNADTLIKIDLKMIGEGDGVKFRPKGFGGTWKEALDMARHIVAEEMVGER